MIILTFQYDKNNHAAPIQFFKDNLVKLRELRRLIVNKDRTEILDINGDKMVFDGLTYGDPVLEDLLRMNFVFFDAATLHNPAATASGVKEFTLSARYPWGHDRIL